MRSQKVMISPLRKERSKAISFPECFTPSDSAWRNDHISWAGPTKASASGASSVSQISASTASSTASSDCSPSRGSQVTGNFREDHIIGHVAALKRVPQRWHMIECRRDGVFRTYPRKPRDKLPSAVFHGPQQRHDMRCRWSAPAWAVADLLRCRVRYSRRIR